MRELLTSHGYEGRYMRKMKRNGIGWPHTQIGNAVFWKAECFEYLEHVDVRRPRRRPNARPWSSALAPGLAPSPSLTRP